MWIFGWLTITFVLLGIILLCIPTDRYYYTLYSIKYWVGFWSIVGGVMLWIFTAIDYKLDFESRVYNADKIVGDTMLIKSAALNSELQGTFVLGCGSIDSKDVYKFYEITDTAGTSYRMKTLPVANTRIQEVLNSDSTFVPKVVTYYYTEYTKTNSWIYHAVLNVNEQQTFSNLRILKEHVIYVPKGTIVDDLSKLNL